MEKQRIYDLLTKELTNSIVKIDEPMKQHTSFKIGGNADIFVISKSIEDIKNIIELAKKYDISVTILGNGSNVLVSDKGIRGIVLKIALDYINIKREKEYALIEVQSGVLLGKLAQILLKEQIGNFEFASGIPGTMGGAIRMNAGAYGSEMKEIVEEVTFLDENNNLVTISKKDCEFDYRHSRFEKSKDIIVSTILKLPYRDEKEIKVKMDEYAQSRKEKQPINFPSAGSTFKRGTDFITAKLIDECGLKGYTVGNAGVSLIHAGFIVNFGDATADDVLKVIEYVKKIVFEKSGKQIELEIQLLGEGIEKR